MPLEIFQNALLKLIVRNGPNSDRENVILSNAELAYTTDTKRLYIGDGVTLGGILAGNKFVGESTNITTLAPAEIGDWAFDTDNNNIYRLKSNDGSVIGDWQLIAGTYSAGNGSIVISSDNKITVGSLSAGVIHPSAAVIPIFIDGNNKIALSANITADSIRPRNASALTLFQSLSIGGINYNWPTTSPPVGGFLRVTNSNNNLQFETISLSSISTRTITVVHPLTAYANGVNVTGTAVNPLTANITIGVSPILSCVNLWARYSAGLNSIISNKGISAVNRTSTGHYTFTYNNPIGNSNPYANANLIGTNAMFYRARVTAVNDVSCDVVVYSSDNPFLFADCDLALKIET